MREGEMCGYEELQARPREIPNPRMKLCNIDSGVFGPVRLIFLILMRVDPIRDDHVWPLLGPSFGSLWPIWLREEHSSKASF